MIKLPDFVYVKAFWQALAFSLAGLTGVGVMVGWLDSKYLMDAGVVLTFFLSLLKVFDIEPQVKLRLALLNAEKLVALKKGKK